MERPAGGFEGFSTPESSRAVIVEPHPAVRAVLEFLLCVVRVVSGFDELGRAGSRTAG